MDNIKELMKEKVKHYGKKERKRLIEEAADALGETKYLVICMEELSELANVISSNVIDKFDYYHTAEEITDVIIVRDILYVVCNVEPKDVGKSKNLKPKKVSIESLKNLSQAIQNISKYIRYNKNGYDKIVEAIELIDETIPALVKLFKIKEKDLVKIRNLKHRRLEERLMLDTIH